MTVLWLDGELRNGRWKIQKLVERKCYICIRNMIPGTEYTTSLCEELRSDLFHRQWDIRFQLRLGPCIGEPLLKSVRCSGLEVHSNKGAISITRTCRRTVFFTMSRDMVVGYMGNASVDLPEGQRSEPQTARLFSLVICVTSHKGKQDLHPKETPTIIWQCYRFSAPHQEEDGKMAGHKWHIPDKK